jgi:hypothetical protein
VREALWLEVPGIAEFVRSVYIPSAKTARLCLFMAQREGPCVVIEDIANRSGIKPLKAGAWRLRIILTMDNNGEYVLSGTVRISEEHKISYEPIAFT